MTDERELDRLDRVAAEAMGWLRKRHLTGGRHYVFRWIRPFEPPKCEWSPTRNAADRDELDAWVFCYPTVQTTWLVHNFEGWHYTIEPEQAFNIEGDGETPGVAVCRAVEIMTKGERI